MLFSHAIYADNERFPTSDAGISSRERTLEMLRESAYERGYDFVGKYNGSALADHAQCAPLACALASVCSSLPYSENPVVLGCGKKSRIIGHGLAAAYGISCMQRRLEPNTLKLLLAGQKCDHDLYRQGVARPVQMCDAESRKILRGRFRQCGNADLMTFLPDGKRRGDYIRGCMELLDLLKIGGSAVFAVGEVSSPDIREAITTIVRMFGRCRLCVPHGSNVLSNEALLVCEQFQGVRVCADGVAPGVIRATERLLDFQEQWLSFALFRETPLYTREAARKAALECMPSPNNNCWYTQKRSQRVRVHKMLMNRGPDHCLLWRPA